MPDINEKEKKFLVQRAGAVVQNIIMFSDGTLFDAALQSYQAGYRHAYEDRKRITEKVDNNG